jgi:hypothetical protein
MCTLWGSTSTRSGRMASLARLCSDQSIVSETPARSGTTPSLRSVSFRSLRGDSASTTCSATAGEPKTPSSGRRPASTISILSISNRAAVSVFTVASGPVAVGEEKHYDNQDSHHRFLQTIDPSLLPVGFAPREPIGSRHNEPTGHRSRVERVPTGSGSGQWGPAKVGRILKNPLVINFAQTP